MRRSSSALFVLALCCAIISAFICFTTIVVFADETQEAAGPSKKTLVLLDSAAQKASHSQLLQILEKKGYQLDVRTVSAAQNLKIEEYGTYLYHNLIILAPESSNFEKTLNAKSIMDFVDRGAGNVIIASSTKLNSVLRSVADESGIQFDDDRNVVIDHFHYDSILDISSQDVSTVGHHSAIVTRGLYAGNNSAVVLGSLKKQPVLFHGLGMSLDSTKLLLPILRANPTSYTYNIANIGKSNAAEPFLRGLETVLVGGLQSRNGARMTFVGSLDMLSNRYFDAQVNEASGNSAAAAQSGNRAFAQEVFAWALQERGLLRWRQMEHKKIAAAPGEVQQRLEPTTTTHKSYRILDEIEYSVIFEEWSGALNKWIPFEANDDAVQLDFVMLHPYVRTNLKHRGNGTYAVQFKIPDVYGVYKFVIEHRRAGYSLLSLQHNVAVRPLKMQEYERFIQAAWPYYSAFFTVMAGFAVFSIVFLYSKDEPAASGAGAKKTTKTE